MCTVGFCPYDSSSLLPWGGSSASITSEEMYFLYRIIHGQPPNLGEFLARRMTIRRVDGVKVRQILMDFHMESL